MRRLALTFRSLLAVFSCCLVVLGCPRPSGAVRPDEGDKQPRVEVKPDAAADAALADALAVSDAKGLEKGLAALWAVRRTYPLTTAGQQALFHVGTLAFGAKDYATARKALNELLFENPLHAEERKARLLLGLSAMELGAYRDAYQQLSSIAPKLEGEDRRRAEEGAARAAELGGISAEALRLALAEVEGASGDEERRAALERLTEVVEARADFIDVARTLDGLSTGHPAWPLLTFKLARIYYHLRDWTRLEETVARFLSVAPDSPHASTARAMIARASARGRVKANTVGAVLPMTGRYQPIGEALLRGIQLALHGSGLELVVKDSQGDPQLAAKAIEELAFDDQAIAALGPVLGDEAKRAAVVADELQLPLLTLTRSENITAIGPYIFRNMLTNSAQAKALAEYATLKLGMKSFAVLYPNIGYGVELTNSFWDAVEERGGVVRGAEAYDYDQTTFTNEARKLVGRYDLEERSDYREALQEVTEKEKDPYRRRKAVEKVKSGLKPVVDFEALLLPDDWKRVGLVAPALAVEDIITNACDPKDLEKIKKTTGNEDLQTVTLLGTNQWSSPKGRTGLPELLERGGKFVVCSIYVDGFYIDSSRKPTRRFVNAYRESNKELPNRDPGLLEAVSYDSAAILRHVIEKQSPPGRGELREALSQLRNFEGATGQTSFDDRREAVKPLFFLSIEPKGLVELPPVGAKPGGS